MTLTRSAGAAGAALRAATVVVVVLALASCASSGTSGTAGAAGTCPGGEPVKVVASVDQWGDIARSLGGACVAVTTVIKSSAADPHDYEPTVGDLAAFDRAQLVVVNGLDYDAWAVRAADTAGSEATRVSAAEVAGVADGANPHLWYSPGYVAAVSTALTAELKRLAPASSAYFDARATAWGASSKQYRALIASIGAEHPKATYAATESVFDYMAQAVGLTDVTPPGYRDAAANESDPSPGDVAAFEDVLRERKADVLIFNTQTEGSVPAQLRRTAEAAGVPVVEVTETVADGAAGFLPWQVTQLTALQKALATS